MPTTYLINSKRAISETIDGETIIIDLNNGFYYSMNETGSAIWEFLKAGNSIEDIIKFFKERYKDNREILQEKIVSLVNELENHNLIKQEQFSPNLLKAPQSMEQSFVTPAIEKYEDMQEMLLADPIHDVDEMGWPNLKETN